MENNFTYASYTRRVMSNIIDGTILLILILFKPIKYDILDNINPYIDKLYIIIFLYILVYHSLFIYSGWQATPGKKLVGIKVINSEGHKLGFGFIVLRYTLALSCYIIAITICGYALGRSMQLLGYFVILLGAPLICVLALFLMYFCFRCFDKKRTFYDKVSKSHVVEV
jgi:uncharacterized RDD family membrane protein YckC